MVSLRWVLLPNLFFVDATEMAVSEFPSQEDVRCTVKLCLCHRNVLHAGVHAGMFFFLFFLEMYYCHSVYVSSLRSRLVYLRDLPDDGCCFDPWC